MIKRKNINDSDSLFFDFINEKELNGLSQKTIQDYKSVYKRFKLEINEKVSKESIEKWILFLQSKEMSAISINFYIRHIRVFYYWLANNGFVELYKVKLLKQQEPRLKYFTDEELLKLVAKPSRRCSFTDFRAWTIINFILATGARASTIVNIEINDIDFDNKEITYRHLKNKSLAIIPMSLSLYKCLKEYLYIWDIKSNYLFPNKLGKKLTSYALTQSIRKFCLTRKVSSYGPHTLRHTFARKYIMNGGNAFVLQKLLTHSDLTMTKKYVRLFSTDLHCGFDDSCPLDIITNRIGIKRRL